MQDERPIDLSELGGDELARDLVGPAVLRFRLRVVLVTVVMVVAATLLAYELGGEFLSRRESQQMVADALVTRFRDSTQVNTRQAWSSFGSFEAGTLDVRVLQDGTMALRVVVIEDEGTRRCCMLVTSPASDVQPWGVNWSDPFIHRARLHEYIVGLPPDIGRRFEVQVYDEHAGELFGSFTVDLDELKVREDLESYLTPDES